MTLNITVTTRRCIYQSADYRLMDLKTGKRLPFETQKIVLVNAYKWTATVCFAGVGRTDKLDVGEWLAERVAAIQSDDPFERLLDELLKADDWLSAVRAPDNKHSFSVGAFVGSEPVFALVSNFEQPGLEAPTASAKLSVFTLRPTKPKTFISGQKQAVTRSVRRRLAALAARDPDPQRMCSALAEVNRDVALMLPEQVSLACFTAHVHLTGEGGGYAHHIGDRPFNPTFAVPEVEREAITRLLDERFGPGRARLRAISTVRMDASDEYHETQLREKPEDPSVHSNYGVFLKEKKGDREGAERQYRRAIELNRNHVNALGNLANLLWEKGDRGQAADLYRRAFEVDPGNENVTYNYARFLNSGELNDRKAARDALDRGITTHPESGRLFLLRAQLSVLDGNVSEALADLRQAREKGADPAEVENCHACALQLSGAPIGECIATYFTAMTLNPKNGALRLNLAQLLFIEGDNADANRRLHEAMKSGLDDSAQLEAQFYLLSHTSIDPAAIFQTTKSLLARGARLRWNVRPNIETVSRRDPNKAVLLEIVAKVMAGEGDPVLLDQVLARWA
jgi:Flp pilus assembly protein TadD